jgi:hypothetical protein
MEQEVKYKASGKQRSFISNDARLQNSTFGSSVTSVSSGIVMNKQMRAWHERK